MNPRLFLPTGTRCNGGLSRYDAFLLSEGGGSVFGRPATRGMRLLHKVLACISRRMLASQQCLSIASTYPTHLSNERL